MTAGNMGVVYLTIREMAAADFKGWLKWGIVLIWGCTIGYYIYSNHKINTYQNLVQAKADRLSYNDTIIWFAKDEMRFWLPIDIKSLDYGQTEGPIRHHYRAPEQLREIRWDRDTNAVINLGHNRFLIVQSKAHPAEFQARRKVNLGVAEVPIPTRKFNFEKFRDTFILDNDYWRAHVYTPRNEFMNVDVEMISPEH